MTKYKVGSLVKIVSNKSRHNFNIGEIVRIKNVDSDGSYVAEDLRKIDYWFLEEDEFEPAIQIDKVDKENDYKKLKVKISKNKKFVKVKYVDKYGNKVKQKFDSNIELKQLLETLQGDE